MATRIRLARGGAKKRPFYSLVVADSRSPRDGRFIEKIGIYDPTLPAEHTHRLVVKRERAEHWLATGALPTERVHSLLARLGLLEPLKRPERPQQSAPKAKAQERTKEQAAKEAKRLAAVAAAAASAE